MVPLAVLLLLQAPAVWTAVPDSATVGDTVVFSRTLPAPAGARVRAQPLPRTPLAEPLGDPVVDHRGGLLILRYAVALFEPGLQALRMPAAEVLYPDGTSETVEGETARIRVRSVLPRGDSLPPPRPSLAPLPRPLKRVAPLALLAGAVVLGTGAWAVARRRVRSRPQPAEPPRATPGPPLGQWVEAGELRAVATAVAEEFRRQLSRYEPAAGGGLGTEEYVAVLRRRQPDWPVSEIADVLRALERARFAPAVASEVTELGEQVARLIHRVRGTARGRS